MPLQLIDDGYTLDGTVQAGHWPAVTVKYRPALPAKVREYLIARSKAQTGIAEVKAIAEFLSTQLVSWDVLAGPDKPAPVTEGSIRRLPDSILQKLVDLVSGYGMSEAEADEKNSGTGCASS